jgi:hypothetical protein
MFEKAKRKRDAKLWKFSLWLHLGIVLIIIVLSSCIFNFDSLKSEAYATRAWTDPVMICSTAWYMLDVPESFEPILAEEISAANLPIELTSIMRAGSRGHCAYDDSDYNELDLYFAVQEDLFDDDAALGDLVAAIVPLVEAHEAELWFYPNIIVIGFSHPERQLYQGWRIDYTEAKRAVEAGLDGEDLWLIGQ